MTNVKVGDEEVTLEEFMARVSQRWYKYGRRSFHVLFGRIHNGHRDLFHPVWRVRMWIQRVQQGYSSEDVWSFDSYLTGVIRGGVEELRRINHGHPSELTAGEWSKILTEIVEGMRAAERLAEPTFPPDELRQARDQAAFDLAMKHLHEWWFGLWD